MKNIYNVLVLLFALNFLALAGGIGWLVKTGKLDKARITEIQAILFPPDAPEAPVVAEPAEEDPATQPLVRLEELLAQKSGLPVGQQVEFLQQTFDAKMAEIDRRQRELLALKDQVERAQAELDAGRTKLLTGEQALEAREQEAARLANDKGFQDSLELYNSLPARQVKKIFLTLDDETVVRYLRAMDPRTAAKTIKEYKTPEEVGRIQQIMEKIRVANAAPEQNASTKE